MNDEQREMFHDLLMGVEALVEITTSQQKELKAIKKLLKTATTKEGSLRITEVYDVE